MNINEILNAAPAVASAIIAVLGVVLAKIVIPIMQAHGKSAVISKDKAQFALWLDKADSAVQAAEQLLTDGIEKKDYVKKYLLAAGVPAHSVEVVTEAAVLALKGIKTVDGVLDGIQTANTDIDADTIDEVEVPAAETSAATAPVVTV